MASNQKVISERRYSLFKKTEEGWKRISKLSLPLEEAMKTFNYLLSQDETKKILPTTSFPPQKLYIIGNQQLRIFKIGVSANVSQRFMRLKFYFPPLLVLHIFEVQDVEYLENYLKLMFRSKRLLKRPHQHLKNYTEWFSLDEEDIQTILNFIRDYNGRKIIF